MKKIFRQALYNILTTLMDREKLLFLLSNKQERILLGFKKFGYLYDIGWINSITTEKIVDPLNNPLPWVTYPFIKFIEQKLTKTLDVFEFGSGNSTLFYAERVASVSSVESDPGWYHNIKNIMPLNVGLFYCELVENGMYSHYAHITKKQYDLIIVDGSDRVNCCINCITALKPQGVLVLDDSERPEYDAGAFFLTENGFKRIDFWGMAPVVNYLKCTTLFYKADNCLNL